MGENVPQITAAYIHNERGWPIYSGPRKIEKRRYLEDQQRRFTQDVASLICAKTRQPIWKLTARGRTSEAVRMRQLLAAVLILHPYGGISYTQAGRILNRDRSTVLSTINRIRALCRYPNLYPHADDLNWISEWLPKLNPDYGQFNLLEALRGIPKPIRKEAFQSETIRLVHKAAEREAAE